MNENEKKMSEETIKLEYNTERERLQITEYGRNVLKMVEHLKEIPDRAKRSEQAVAVVKTMELLNPGVKAQEEWEHKLWDQLYIIAGFDLDIDSPFPCPVKEEFETKPVPLPMKGTKIKATHYGRNIEKIIDLEQRQRSGRDHIRRYRKTVGLQAQSAGGAQPQGLVARCKLRPPHHRHQASGGQQEPQQVL